MGAAKLILGVQYHEKLIFWCTGSDKLLSKILFQDAKNISFSFCNFFHLVHGGDGTKMMHLAHICFVYM